MTNLPPEKCGSLATTCRKCGAVMELPELHYHLCTLADQRDRLAGLLRIVADRHEHGQPIPSREIAAVLAELEKKP